VTVVERASKFLEKRVSRRSFINRSAFIGSAVVAGSGVDLMLKPGTAYGAICSCAGDSCDCGSTCCAGYSEFCCTLNGGYNYCPTGTIMGGWWKADNSSYCGGPRYYMDCNAQCACGCPSGSGFCAPGCDGVNCGCALGNCNNFVSGCFQFRYGQCNQDVGCIGRIVCRVVACVPPWTVDPTCTTTNAVDDGTAEQNVACWTTAPPSPPPPPPPPEEFMPVAAPISFAGLVHVFQVNGGGLWHKWSADAFNWSNESVFGAAGIAQQPLPNQLPGASTFNNRLMVTVEDANGRAWFFSQPPGGPWGVGELP
jgi:hypothetical protein